MTIVDIVPEVDYIKLNAEKSYVIDFVSQIRENPDYKF